MAMGTYKLLFYGGLTLAIVFLVLSIILFFVLKIPKALGVITGRTEKKAIEEIRSGGTQKKKRRTTGGSITAREVSASSQSGVLEKQQNEKIAKAAAKDAKKMAASQEEERTAAARQAASVESTEVLKYGRSGNSEDATTMLGYDVSESATNVLEGTGGDDGETDVLTSDGKSTVAGPEPAKRAAGDDGETDVLTSSGKRASSYDDDATDVLRSDGHGAAKASRAGADDATDILREEIPDDGDIIGEYAQDETAVLKAGMDDVPDPEDYGIRVIQSETVVHTDESL